MTLIKCVQKGIGLFFNVYEFKGFRANRFVKKFAAKGYNTTLNDFFLNLKDQPQQCHTACGLV